MVDTLPYGSWPSPFTAQWASASSPRIDGAAFVGDEIWWGQSIPEEGGRTTVRRRTDAGTAQILPPPWSALPTQAPGAGAAAIADDVHVAAAVAQVAADLVRSGHCDWLDLTDLGLDRFDADGRSRVAPEPISLPFPETTEALTR